MPCFSPLTGYRSSEVGPSGKRAIVFDRAKGYADRPVIVPCGQCIGCRLEKSRQWAIRCVHEAACHDSNVFITLTYNDDFLPPDLSLDTRHFQLFMKRLRKQKGAGVRFFHCGEYGEKLGRPHYHALLFNCDFEDKVLWRMTDFGNVYTSANLQSLWGMGFCTLGDVTFRSAAYVARYVMKKQYGECAKDHYTWVDASTGEVHVRKPEYVTMSRRPGVGTAWLNQFQSDVYPDDFVILDGKKLRAPRFYDAVIEKSNPGLFRDIKRRRVLNSKRHSDNNTKERLRVREAVQLAKLKRLKRELVA